MNDEAASGDPITVSVVQLCRRGHGPVVTIGSGWPVELNDGDQFNDRTNREVLAATVELSAPGDAPWSCVSALLAAPVPRAFRNNSWFRRHRAVVFRDGRCRVGELVLLYRDGIGLCFEGFE